MLGAITSQPDMYYYISLTLLLIRQLSIECGYSGASIGKTLQLRVHHEEMSGILLYTSSSDSDGSLGGLVRKDCRIPSSNYF